MTKKAVIALQEKHNLTETGIFDTAAYNALLENPNPDYYVPFEDPEVGTPRTVYVLTIYSEDEAAIKAIQNDHGGTLASVEAVG